MSNPDGSPDIAELTLAHRGGTFDARTLRPVNPGRGYVVSVTSEQNACAPERIAILETVIFRIMRDYPDAPYIGTWENPEDGLIYVDPVTILPRKRDALRLARKHEQVAIYDIKRGIEVYVDPIPADEGSRGVWDAMLP